MSTIFRKTLVCLVAALAMSVVATATASAITNNPKVTACLKHAGAGEKFKDSACKEKSSTGKWEIVELKEKETMEILAEAKGTQKLNTGGSVIACKKVKFAKGAKMIGGEPVTDEETIEYEECEVEGHANCEINKEKAGKGKLTNECAEVHIGISERGSSQKSQRNDKRKGRKRGKN